MEETFVSIKSLKHASQFTNAMDASRLLKTQLLSVAISQNALSGRNIRHPLKGSD
jgi:hypothetical protein